MLIGLTGYYCAGKNHIAAILEKHGLTVLDVDKLGHQALETEKETILAQFGHDLQKPDGSLDRRLLGQRVHGKPEKLGLLESIVHPKINQLTEEWIKSKDRPCVINAAILHKSSVFSRLDRIIIVTAPFFTRFLRARRRDRLSCREILNRFASQRGFFNQYLSINANPKCAEIYKVENPGLFKPSLTCSRNLKLEKKIDKIIEGI
jgi:dephospho-CoA kinase